MTSKDESGCRSRIHNTAKFTDIPTKIVKHFVDRAKELIAIEFSIQSKVTLQFCAVPFIFFTSNLAKM